MRRDFGISMLAIGLMSVAGFAQMPEAKEIVNRELFPQTYQVRIVSDDKCEEFKGDEVLDKESYRGDIRFLPYVNNKKSEFTYFT